MYMMVQVKEEEKTQRQDLYVLATGYSGQLRNRLAHMMRESDFHQVRFKRIVKKNNFIIRTINFVSVRIVVHSCPLLYGRPLQKNVCIDVTTPGLSNLMILSCFDFSTPYHALNSFYTYLNLNNIKVKANFY